MPISSQQRQTVDELFRAMQAGPGGEEAMMALFNEDAVFVEPFSGQPQTHAGKAAIRESFRQQWENPLPNLRLVLDRVDIDGPRIRAEWHCTSPVLPAPMRGVDYFTLDAGGKIDRLVIEVDHTPHE